MIRILLFSFVLLLIPDVKAIDSATVNFETLTFDKDVNNGPDQALVQKMRQELASAHDLSLSAKNIKIIVVKKEITLKGPVESEEEKNKVKNLVSKISKDHVLRDQMEIAPTREVY